MAIADLHGDWPHAVVALRASTGADYASNVHPPTFPDGLDCEVFTRAALEIAWREATTPAQREHVTPFLHGSGDRFLCVNLSRSVARADARLTVDDADDLARRGVPHRRDVPLGVMIETPAAAIAADTFAGEVAFLSLGTNDLVQYTLAVDRGNASLVTRFTPLHPAVLRLIARTVEAGRASGVEVSVCGEMASQPLMAYALLGLGVRTLSVAATGIPLVKRLVRGDSIAAAAAAAEAAPRAATAADVERGLRAALINELGESTLDGLLGLT